VTPRVLELEGAGRSEHRRLFVPLARLAYEWFASGQKKWEVRRARGQFSVEKLTVGRRVELRLGYQKAESAFWGSVTDVALAPFSAPIQG